jgi:3-dehydroquinate synthase
MEHIIIDLKHYKYPVYFNNTFNELPQIMKEQQLSNKVLIVTDNNVEKHYYNTIEKLLIDNEFNVYKYVFEAGEVSKTLNTISGIYDCCLDNRLDRNSTIIALGGGVVGDISGFAASTYMRGINFMQVPTSLLAQVDSSVGGKVGVDYKGSKNIIGSFYQPLLVYINIDVLKTLEKRQYIAGLAEVIKHGIIYDDNFFKYIDDNSEKILEFDYEILKYLVRKNCEIKADVVQQDEREKGLRAILNFGHTIGHAIESISRFSLLHGECVSIGINAACFIANNKKLLSDNEYEKVLVLLEKVGLPISIIKQDKSIIYNEMLRDKKQVSNQLKFILPEKIGLVIQTFDVTEEDINKAIAHVMR